MPQDSGENHFRSKLSTRQVDEIRDLRESRPEFWSYLSLQDYCEQYFGIRPSMSCVRDIVKYRTRVRG